MRSGDTPQPPSAEHAALLSGYIEVDICDGLWTQKASIRRSPFEPAIWLSLKGVRWIGRIKLNKRWKSLPAITTRCY